MSAGVKSVWDGDKLDREASAKYLTDYLNALFAEEVEGEVHKSSHVLNINAGWGYGKTFFIQKWVKKFEVEGQPVIYFDAWSNDFAEDPLLAFIAELEDGLKPYFKNVPKGAGILQKAMKAGRNVLMPIATVAANATVSSLSGGLITDLTSGQKVNLVDSAIEAYREKKNAIVTFKNKLNELVKALENNSESKLPIYIFIDELDRCRPTYAVSLLEAIKHIFGVYGFYFIVATNRTELSHSVKAIYGSEFDALTYLRRFFDQEYNLPSPDNKKFAVYLMDRFRIKSDQRLYTPVQNRESDTDSVPLTFSLLATGLEISLRDQVQVAMQLKSILLTSKFKVIHIMYLIFIMMLRHKSEHSLDSFLNLNSSGVSFPEYENFKVKDITFLGFVPKQDHGSSFGMVKLKDAIEVYRKNIKANAIDLHNIQIANGTLGRITQELKSEAPNSYDPDKHYPLSISSYPELVLQAGQLIV